MSWTGKQEREIIEWDNFDTLNSNKNGTCLTVVKLTHGYYSNVMSSDCGQDGLGEEKQAGIVMGCKNYPECS